MEAITDDEINKLFQTIKQKKVSQFLEKDIKTENSQIQGLLDDIENEFKELDDILNEANETSSYMNYENEEDNYYEERV